MLYIVMRATMYLAQLSFSLRATFHRQISGCPVASPLIHVRSKRSDKWSWECSSVSINEQGQAKSVRSYFVHGHFQQLLLVRPWLRILKIFATIVLCNVFYQVLIIFIWIWRPNCRNYFCTWIYAFDKNFQINYYIANERFSYKRFLKFRPIKTHRIVLGGGALLPLRLLLWCIEGDKAESNLLKGSADETKLGVSRLGLPSLHCTRHGTPRLSSSRGT